MNKARISKAAGAVLGLAMLIGGQIASGQTTINMNVPGTAVDRGILGTNYFSERWWAPVADRTVVTGTATGHNAELYDWQTQFPYPWWNTIGVLQTIRDSGSQPMFQVNMRGRTVGTEDNYDYASDWSTIDDVAGLATLAAEWVRYTNFILPNGGPITPNDQTILNKLTFGPLPPPGQPALPTVKYWEIGNEPDANIYGTEFTAGSETPDNHQHYLDSAGYVYRYKTITNAMKAVDPSIKVGPAMSAMTNPVGPASWEPHVAKKLLQSDATIDFWAYHAYDALDVAFKPNGNASEIAAMEGKLRQVKDYQRQLYNLQRSFFSKYGRDPNQVEFRATEWNAMGTGDNLTSAPTMYQALAFTETIFSFAQLGVKSANYWGVLAYEPQDPKGYQNLWPMVQVWQKLNGNIGTTLVGSAGDDSSNQRVYVTRDDDTGKVTVWGLNFSNSADASIALVLQGLSGQYDAVLSILNAGANTTLWTASDAQLGTYVSWTSQALNGFNPANFSLSIPHASISMLELTPVPERPVWVSY